MPPLRVRVTGYQASVVDANRLELGEDGEPRILEGTAVVVDRESVEVR